MSSRWATVCRFVLLALVTNLCSAMTIGDNDYLLEGESWCMTCSRNETCGSVVWLIPSLEKPNRTISCISGLSKMCIPTLRSIDTGIYKCTTKNKSLISIRNLHVFGRSEAPTYAKLIGFTTHRDVNYMILRLKFVKDFYTFDWTLPPNSTAQSENRLHHGTDLIRISDYRETDNGDYACRIFNRFNNQSAVARFTDIFVNDPLRPVLDDVYATPGQLLNITCRTDGNDVTWAVGHFAHFNEHDTLNLTNRHWQHVDPDRNHSSTTAAGKDNRIYVSAETSHELWAEVHEPFGIRCTVKHGRELNSTKWIATANVYMLDWDMTQQPGQMFVGNRSVVKCSGSIEQLTNSLRLHKNGVAVTGHEHGLQLRSEIIAGRYVITLTFAHIHLNDAGRYTCSAETKTHVPLQQDVEVLVFDAPRFVTSTGGHPVPESDDIEVVLDQPLALECYAVGYPVPDVQWFFKNKIAVNATDTKSVNRTLLQIDRVAAKHIGTYECRAQNAFGAATHQFNVHTEFAVVLYASVFGCTIVTMVAVLGIVLLVYRRKVQQADSPYSIKYNQDETTEAISMVDKSDHLPYDTRFDFAKMNLSIKQRLGSGAYGDVFFGVALGITQSEYKTPVAVKCAKNRENTNDIKSLIAEVKIMIHIGKHLNVLQLLGVVHENLNERELLVITEYCPFGNLHDFLRKKRKHFRVVSLMAEDDGAGTEQPTPNDGGTRGVCTTDLVCWSYQVTQGMHFLANNGILHGDLAARNILLTHDNMIRICDFGLSRKLRFREDYQKATDCVLPQRWLAIESLVAKTFNSSSDVWSFGVLMWELWKLGARPYANIDARDILPKLLSGYRLKRPKFADPKLYAIMRDCWNAVPTQRPRFYMIGQRLEEFLPVQLVRKIHDRSADYDSCRMDVQSRTKYLSDLALSTRPAPGAAGGSIC